MKTTEEMICASCYVAKIPASTCECSRCGQPTGACANCVRDDAERATRWPYHAVMPVTICAECGFADEMKEYDLGANGSVP
jgi:hypothetical protein